MRLITEFTQYGDGIPQLFYDKYLNICVYICSKYSIPEFLNIGTILN